MIQGHGLISIVTILVLAAIVWLVANRVRNTLFRLNHDRRKINVASRTIFLITVLNFGIWAMGTIALHGDAISGKTENYKYYVRNKVQYTEVSKAAYIYSYIHTASVIISFSMAIVILAIADIVAKR